jgi:hypothetical protein
MRIHRFIAGLLGILAGIALTAGSAAQERTKAAPTKDAHTVHAQHYWDCAKACDDCARLCEACASHCARLVANGRKEHLDTLVSCQDCATVCSAAGSVTARLGPYSDSICSSCADVCKRCGDACEKFKDDPMMKKCAEECRKCEQACREMLKHVRTDGTTIERK